MRTAVEILTARLCWRFARWLRGDETLEKFLGRFGRYDSKKSGHPITPNQIQGWEKGTAGMSKGMVRRLDSISPGTKHVYLLHWFLRRRGQRSENALGLMKQHDFLVVDPDGSRNWQFPTDAELKDRRSLPTLRSLSDSDRLLQRSDFFAMLAMLALIRDASARRNGYDEAIRHVENLYRLLPAIVQLQWVRPDADLLLQCIEDMVRSKGLYIVFLSLKWPVFQAHAQSRDYALNLRVRSHDPATGKFVARPVDVVDHFDLGTQPRPVPIFPDGRPHARWVRPQVRVEAAPPRGRSLSRDLEHLFDSLNRGRSGDEGH